MTQYVKCIMCYYLYLSVMYCRFSFGCLDMLRYSHHGPLSITLILTPSPPCPVTIIIIIIYKDAISSAFTLSLPRCTPEDYAKFSLVVSISVVFPQQLIDEYILNYFKYIWFVMTEKYVWVCGTHIQTLKMYIKNQKG